MKHERSLYQNFNRHSHTFSIFKEHSTITIVMEKDSFVTHNNSLLEKFFDIFDAVTDFVAKFLFLSWQLKLLEGKVKTHVNRFCSFRLYFTSTTKLIEVGN